MGSWRRNPAARPSTTATLPCRSKVLSGHRCLCSVAAFAFTPRTEALSLPPAARWPIFSSTCGCWFPARQLFRLLIPGCFTCQASSRLLLREQFQLAPDSMFWLPGPRLLTVRPLGLSSQATTSVGFRLILTTRLRSRSLSFLFPAIPLSRPVPGGRASVPISGRLATRPRLVPTARH